MGRSASCLNINKKRKGLSPEEASVCSCARFLSSSGEGSLGGEEGGGLCSRSRQPPSSESCAGNGSVTCACIPLARVRSYDHTQLQGRLGNAVLACAQAEAEDLDFGERLRVCEGVEYVGLLL